MASHILNGWPHDHGPTYVRAMVKRRQFWRVYFAKYLIHKDGRIWIVKFEGKPEGKRKSHPFITQGNQNVSIKFISPGILNHSIFNRNYPSPASPAPHFSMKGECGLVTQAQTQAQHYMINSVWPKLSQERYRIVEYLKYSIVKQNSRL